MNALLCHLMGDYLVQNQWMADEKTKRDFPAIVHSATYAACFLPLTRDPRRLAFIAGTHYVIDRYRLARHVVWAKNQLVPKRYRYVRWVMGPYGGHWQGDQDQPHIHFWLMIIVDNLMHGICNEVALSV